MIIRNPTFTPAKQQEHRVPFWATVDRLVRVPPPDRRVVILDTGQALETRYLWASGYRQIAAVNRTPAHVAWLTRRYPQVMTYRGALAEVVEFLVDTGWQPAVVNYDGMGQIAANDLPETVVRLAKALKPGALLGVTITPCRELNAGARQVIYRRRSHVATGLPLSRQNQNRLAYLITLCQFGGKRVERIKVGQYFSGAHNMLWALMQLGTGRQTHLKLL